VILHSLPLFALEKSESKGVISFGRALAKYNIRRTVIRVNHPQKNDKMEKFFLRGIFIGDWTEGSIF
jgi:hypothetical protein